MLEKPSEKDKRRFGRRPVFKPMTVVQGAGERLDDHIVDISEGGARIQLDGTLSRLLKDFYLEIPEDDIVVKCRLVHLQPASAGVEFVRPSRRLSLVRFSPGYPAV